MSTRRWAARARYGIAASLVLLAWIAPGAGAASEPRFASAAFVDGTGNVRIEVQLEFSALPRAGFVPARVRIANDTDTSGVWRLEFSDRDGNASGTAMWRAHQTEIRVEARRTREIQVLVPILGWLEGATQLELGVSGPGITMRRVLGAVHGKRAERSVGLGARLAEDFEPSISAFLEGQKNTTDLRGALLARGFEPTSWRALAAFDSVWLLEDEIRELAPGAHRAILDWVLQGGELTVFHRASAPRQSLRVGSNVTLVEGPVGLGRVRLLPRGEGGIRADRIFSYGPALRRDLSSDSAFAEGAPRLELSKGLIALLVLAFFLVAGPGNVFFHTRQGRASALLWTTPCISLAASVLLAGAILLQDGTGGEGQRYVLHFVEPDASREVIVQEQVARTGVLVGGSGFAADPDLYVERYRLDDDRYISWDLRSDADGFAGDWFRTRAVQAHLIHQVRASRARVELVGHRGSGAPVVLSSLPVAVAVLYYVDRAGVVWTAHDLLPGEEVVLAATENRPALARARAALPKGSSIDRLLEETPRKGYFYAIASSRTRAMIPTLESIEWDDRVAIYLGPISTRRGLGGG